MWKEVPEMPKVLDSMGACCHSTNGMLYVGGNDDLMDTTTMYAYNIKEKKWFTKASTHDDHCKEKISLVELSETLYIIGASRYKRFDNNDIEEYSIEKDQWTFIDLGRGPCRKVPADSFWSFAFGDDIFVSGGNLDSDDKDSSLPSCNKHVLKFNPKEKTLEVFSRAHVSTASGEETPMFGVVVVPL